MVTRNKSTRNTSTWLRLALAALLLLAGCRTAGDLVKPGGPDQKQAGIGDAPRLSSKQKIYPWSIVAGGVDSEIAIRNAMREDPVVDAHYSGLKTSALRPQRLEEKMQGYVSYRIRDQVYWTRKPVTLAAGELVLTDGQTMVRGRCGNLVSSVAKQPVAPPALEPPEVAMDTPVIGSQLFSMPDYPKDAVADSTSFTNPRPLASAATAGGTLPSPAATEPMPPAWTAGGISSPGSGVVGVGGGAAPPPAPDQPTVPTPPLPGTPVDVAPPLVHVPLAPPPPPIVPTNPISPPPSDYPPGSPPPPWLPPQYPPVNPPPDGPPPFGPPPSGPPPSGPPSTDPPPNNPPPQDPPPHSDPPPPSPPGPPDVPVPEPGAIVMIILGITGIALGAIRRRS